MSDTIKPILIFTWGNPSRGDDALGPRMYDLLIENALPDVEVLTDFQLQIEHSVDMERRERIIFIDASLSADAPFEFYRLDPREDDSYTTHAMSPQSLLATYQQSPVRAGHRPVGPSAAIRRDVHAAEAYPDNDRPGNSWP